MSVKRYEFIREFYALYWELVDEEIRKHYTPDPSVVQGLPLSLGMDEPSSALSSPTEPDMMSTSGLS